MYKFVRDLSVSDVSCDLLVTTKQLDDTSLTAEDCYLVGSANSGKDITVWNNFKSSNAEVGDESSYAVLTIQNEPVVDGEVAVITMTDFRTDLGTNNCFLYHVDDIKIVVDGQAVSKPSAWDASAGEASVNFFLTKTYDPSESGSLTLQNFQWTERVVTSEVSGYYVNLLRLRLEDKVKTEEFVRDMAFAAETSIFDQTSLAERQAIAYNRLLRALTSEKVLEL